MKICGIQKENFQISRGKAEQRKKDNDNNKVDNQLRTD